MISFNGRSIQKIIISAKSISIGLKLQGFRDKGYIYSWEATRPKLVEFQQNITKFSVFIPETIPPVYTSLMTTQSIIARLVESLSKKR